MAGAGGGSGDIDWAAIGAALGSAGLGAGGSLLAGRQARKTAERLYKNRYQWSVADLRAAGLNPMLAYGGVGGPNQPFTPNILEAPARELGELPGRLQGLAKSRAEQALASAQQVAAAQAAKTGAAQEELARASAQRELSQVPVNQAMALTQAASAEEIKSRELENLQRTRESFMRTKMIEAEFPRKSLMRRPFEWLDKMIEGFQSNAASPEEAAEAGRRLRKLITGGTMEGYEEPGTRPGY